LCEISPACAAADVHAFLTTLASQGLLSGRVA
jgi:hypothetical protein